MPWFAVYTNAKSEPLANTCLREQGNETLYLQYRDLVRHARRKIKVLRPYFPRYLFVRPAQSLYRVAKTQGVALLVCRGDQPLAVPEGVIQDLRARGDAKGIVHLSEEEKRQRLAPGTRVKIKDGPLAGLIAAVSLDTGDKVQVWLNMFSGKVNAELPASSVSPSGRRVDPNQN